MAVINVNNENVVVLNDNDIIYHIEQNCGYELAGILKDRLVIDDYETKLAREKSTTDEEAYLSQLESIECCLRDILDEVEKQQDYLKESKKINRDTILQSMDRIIKMINNEI